MAAHHRIGGQLFGAARRQDAAVSEDVGPIRDRQGFAHVVVGDEHPHTPLAQAADQVLEVGHGQGIDPGEGFIQEEVAGPLNAHG